MVGFPNKPMCFPTKNDHFGVFWGYHHSRKHPYTWVVSSPIYLNNQGIFFSWLKWHWVLIKPCVISPNIPRYFNTKFAFLKITKQTPLKRKRLFQPSIFRCQLAVSFREGNFWGFCLGQTESNKTSPAVKFAPANPPRRMASGGAACYATKQLFGCPRKLANG